MELSQSPRNTDVVLKLSFDATSGVLKIGYSTSPAVNLASALGYRLSTTEASTLARALDAYASVGQP